MSSSDRTAWFRPSSGVRGLMLVAAYAPLLVLMAVLDSFGAGADGSWWLRWAPAFAAGLGVAVTVAFVAVAVRRRAAEPEVVFEARPRDGEAIRFFATYVVPFFILQAATPTHRWALIVYLGLIAVLYLQSEMFAANPVLALFGYRVFELNRSDGGFLLVLTRSPYLAPRQVLDLVPLGGYVYAHRRSDGAQASGPTGGATGRVVAGAAPGSPGSGGAAAAVAAATGRGGTT